MFCLDSSAIIEIFKGSSCGEEILGFIQNFPLFISSLVAHELLSGARDADREKIEKFISESEVIPFGLKEAIVSSKIQAELKKKGQPINKIDVLIAGTCLSNKLIVVTCDKDFLKVEGIIVKYFQKSNKVYK